MAMELPDVQVRERCTGLRTIGQTVSIGCCTVKATSAPKMTRAGDGSAAPRSSIAGVVVIDSTLASKGIRMSDMTFRQLGTSGLTVSTVGLGCNNIGARLDKDASRAVVHAALDAGITLFDTADIYGGQPGQSEDLLGQALLGHRDKVVLATKFGGGLAGPGLPTHEARGSRRYIRASVEGSLRRLRTDYIDLYQIHRPDPRTPIDETLSALDDVVREGKVRYLGTSKFAAWQVVDAERVARELRTARFISTQQDYNLLERRVEAELVPACQHVGVGLLPFFPLANGLLTGKYHREQQPPSGSRLSRPVTVGLDFATANWDVIEGLRQFAAERKITMLDVAIGGLAAQPAVASVIAGATTADQIAANVRAGLWQPTDEDRATLEAITDSRGKA